MSNATTKRIRAGNCGGMGLTWDEVDNLDGLARNEKKPLHILDGFTGERLTSCPCPAGGWTEETLTEKLTSLEAVIQSRDTADAFLGAEFLGSTEL